MGKINDLSQGNLGDLARQQHRDRYATPLNGSSVGRGGQRFYGTGKLTVENEGLYVTGTASIAGTLTVAGTSRFSGQTFIYGPLEVTGDTILDGKTDIGGATKITGTLDVTGKTTLGGDTTVSGKLDVTGAMATKGTLSVEGVTTLKSDLNVTTGKVKVGTMTLDPTVAGGALTFGNGSQVFTDATTIQMFKDNGAVQVTSYAAMLYWGGSSINMDALGARFTNPRSTTNAANVYMDANGYIYRKP